MEKLLWKLIGALTGLVAARTARSLLDKAWARTKGGEPPRNPAAPETTWSEAVTWAAASGIALGLARLIAVRGSAKAWQKGTGHLPPGIEKVGA